MIKSNLNKIDHLHKFIVFSLLLLACSGNAWAQNKNHKSPDYSKDPHWVQMMEDTTVNYFEAKKAFEEYWSKHPLPEEAEEEEMGGGDREKRSLVSRVLVSDKKMEEQSKEYTIHYKRFRSWLINNAPYVQSDGSILSKEEQLQIWENSRK